MKLWLNGDMGRQFRYTAVKDSFPQYYNIRIILLKIKINLKVRYA